MFNIESLFINLLTIKKMVTSLEKTIQNIPIERLETQVQEKEFLTILKKLANKKGLLVERVESSLSYLTQKYGDFFKEKVKLFTVSKQGKVLYIVHQKEKVLRRPIGGGYGRFRISLVEEEPKKQLLESYSCWQSETSSDDEIGNPPQQGTNLYSEDEFARELFEKIKQRIAKVNYIPNNTND